MGLFDRFFGPPSREQFARTFLKQVQHRTGDPSFVYDPKRYCILKPGEHKQEMNLANFYQEHCQLKTSAERSRHIARCIDAMISAQDDLPTDFSEARDHLRPKLWVRAVLEKTRLRAIIDSRDENARGFDIPESPVGTHLVASLVYDLPSAMRSLQPEQFDEWGVTYYEALEAARENLEAAPFNYAKLGDGFYSAMGGDNYDACRLLLPGLLERWEVDGDPIAMVPNRDSLFVTGSNDADGLKAMLALTQKELEEPRPMSPIPLRWDGEEWQDWVVPKDHPLYAGFHELEVEFLSGEYADQKELLEKLFEQQNHDIFVASCSAASRDGEAPFSYAIWPKGIDTLLPKVDRLILCTEEKGEPNVVASGSWEHVTATCGYLLDTTPHYPPRYRVNGFPTPDELRSIGKDMP